MTDTSEVPVIATYSEWIGFGADIPDHTRANIYAAMSSQGGDMDQIATSLHFHKSFGRWVFASAPLKGDPPMTEQQNTRPSASREIAVKPLTFSDGGYAHNGLGTMYRITFHNDANIGWVLYRHEGSSKTGLGAHEDRDELITLACEDNERRILSAIDTTPSNTDPTAKYDDELRKVQGGWRDMDSAPRDGTRILMFVPPYGVSCGHFDCVWDNGVERWIMHSVLNKEAQPSHWMPLPPTPTEHPTEQPSEDALESVIDTIEEIIGETHDIDVTDRRYAENIVAWLKRHHPAALRSLAQEGE